MQAKLKKAISKSNDSDLSESISKDGVSFSRYAVFAFLAVVGGATDLITKQVMFQKYFREDAVVPITHWLIDGWLGIETTTNQGALWGQGQGMQSWFAVLSFLAFIGIIYWLFVKRGAASWLLTIALGMVTGGIFGNLYDRLGLWHGSDMSQNHWRGVRDWIHFRWQDAPGFLQNYFNPWPNFNIADSLLVCGAILLVIHAFFFPHHSPQQDRQQKSELKDSKAK